MNGTVAATALLVLLSACGASAAGRQDGEKDRTPHAKQGWLGVAIQDVTPRMAREKELPVKSGALVNDVTDESPAEKAGIREEDVIVQFNATTVEESDDLRTAVRAASAGDPATITLYRGKEKKTVQVTLGSLPHRDEQYSFRGPGRIVVPRIPRIPPIPRFHIERSDELLGLTLSDLNSQLGEYFGAPGGKGVLVQEVEPKSAGDKCGFKAGDVIVKAGTMGVESIEDISDALDSTGKGEKVEFGVLRKGAHVTLTAESAGDSWNRSRSFRFHGDGLPGFDREGLRREMDHFKEWLRTLKVNVRYLGERMSGASS